MSLLPGSSLGSLIGAAAESGLSGLRGAADVAGMLLGVRRRGVWSRPGRCYIEVRGVDGPRGSVVARLVEQTLESHPGVLWARVNAPSERVVVELAPTPPPLQDLIRLVVRAESRAAAAEAEYGEWCPEPHHPSEEAGQRQSLPALAADGVGLLISAITRLSPWTPLPAEVGALATAIQLHPKLRGFVGKGLRGRDQTESVLPVISALAQGVATRGGGLVLDVAERLSQWREADADRKAWAAAEPRLVRGPEDAAAEPIVVERPGPAHQDIIARHTEQAMAAGAVCGAAVGPYAGPRRGLAVALASEPKAPDAGREGFATGLGRFLARRGVIAMDRGALRRLGQVDTVVLDEDALRGDRYELADLVPLAGTEPETLSERLFELFHPSEPDQSHRNADGWVLGPLEDLDLTGRTGQQAAGRLRRSSDRVLGLARGRRLQAVAGVVAQTMPGVQALTAAARRSGVRLVLATDHSDSAFGFVDAVVHSGTRLMASVRHLQADGAVVLLVSGDRGALGAADCGIGVYRDGEAPAWGADMLVGPDLEAAAVIVDGIGTARRVDQDSSLLAAGGSGVGAIAALQAPPPQACARGQAAGNTAGGIAFCLGLWRVRQLLSHPVTPPIVTTPWHLMPASRVLQELGTSSHGLSARAVGARARTSSRAPEPLATSLPSAVIEELANPLTPVLAAGAALAAAVGSRADAALVAAIMGTSALFGGVQRVQTERALAELTARSAVSARVRRSGATRLVTAEDLVPGDIVVVHPEDVVPADCRLLEADGLEVDESALTGESLPVIKDVAPVVAAHITGRRSMLYEGTTISAGQAVAVVVTTGAATEAGRSAATARQAAPVTGVEARVKSLTKASLPLALTSAAAVTGAGLLHGKRPADIAASAVNLAVASVPEGLPFLINAAQLAAARRLGDRGALVRNPRTIEALGRTDVLCFDKTGTLTEGTLQLAAVSDGGGLLPSDRLDTAHKAVLAAALRATPTARRAEPMAHQTDQAVMAGARRAKVSARRGAAGWRRTSALPFEHSRPYHATSGSTARGDLLSVKGAPESVLPRCRQWQSNGKPVRIGATERQELNATAEELASSGQRVLAVAERPLQPDEELSDEAVDDLIFLGFVSLADLMRPEAAPATAQLREAGVHTVMLTGDHPATAAAVATSVGGTPDLNVRTGAELDALDDAELEEFLPTVDVIARCSPHHKVRIVHAFQRAGRVVAMTGDGANDAPAIRLADVGIALGRRGTPAATAAADLVIGDDRLDTIVAALTEGRAMWASVRTALAILIGGNLGEVAFGVLTSALTGSTALNARQLMLVNLLTDLAPAVAIAVRAPGEDAEEWLREGPDRSLGVALTDEMVLRGLSTTLGAGFAWGTARLIGPRRRASTVGLASVVGTQLAQTLVSGGLDRNVLLAGFGSAALLVGIIQTPGLSQFFGNTPLGPIGWSITLSSITAAMLVNVALQLLARTSRGSTPQDR